MDAISLTRDLLRYDTTNPPGIEGECGRFLARLLSSQGFHVTVQPFDVDRLNIVAQIAGSDSESAPLVLTGHFDTVPLGTQAWTMDPFAGDVKDGKMYGRGVSDMKAGVAAMIVAATRHVERRPKRGITLIFTSGEETGCAGALALATHAPGMIGRASAMIVGEPTGNRIATGHKGCLAVRAKSQGVTAHSSMPDSGNNAIYAAAEAVGRISNFHPLAQADPLLGLPTKNVGTITGGLNYNSVPDSCEFTVDVRTVPGMDHDRVQNDLAEVLGPDIAVERFVDMPPVGNVDGDPFVAVFDAAVRHVLGVSVETKPIGIPFFSDASVFQPKFQCPTLLFGPGEPAMAHQTDEWCRVDNIAASVDVYDEAINRWCS